MSYAEARNGPISIYGDFIWARISAFGGGCAKQIPSASAPYRSAKMGLSRSRRSSSAKHGGLMKSRVGGKTAPKTRSPHSTLIPAFAIGMSRTRFRLTSRRHQCSASGLSAKRRAGSRQVRHDAMDRPDYRPAPSPSNRARRRISVARRYWRLWRRSKFSWQLAGGYSHDMKIGDWTITNTVGYRALSVDYSNGTGSGQKGMDTVIHGPVMETSFRF